MSCTPILSGPGNPSSALITAAIALVPTSSYTERSGAETVEGAAVERPNRGGSRLDSPQAMTSIVPIHQPTRKSGLGTAAGVTTALNFDSSGIGQLPLERGRPKVCPTKTRFAHRLWRLKHKERAFTLSGSLQRPFSTQRRPNALLGTGGSVCPADPCPRLDASHRTDPWSFSKVVPKSVEVSLDPPTQFNQTVEKTENWLHGLRQRRLGRRKRVPCRQRLASRQHLRRK